MAELAYGVFRPRGGAARVGMAVGASVVDLDALGLDVPPGLFAQPTLNPFLAMGRPTWQAVREQVTARLAEGTAPSWPLSEVGLLLLPFQPGDYVDFYSSIEHATNLGRMFRPEGDPLLPNWRHLPVAYHGRSATVVVSGTPIARPSGQLGPGRFGPTEQLDIELEVGFVVGPGNRLGEPIPVERAEEHIFGLVLVNDWSARDIQRWEYQPLGPFLGKSFATTISPWVVPLDALAPHRVDGPPQEPTPLPYLQAREPRNLDLRLEVEVNGEVVSRTGTAGIYWSMAQQLAHATVNGALVRPGDLFASGTISGSEPGTEGSLIELGRPFLADADTVVLRAPELGECTGTVLGTSR